MEFKSDVTRVIDLGDAFSSLGTVSVPYGTYQKVEFKIGFVSSATSPSLMLQGIYTPATGGPAIPVVFRIDRPFEFKFEKKTPTVIDASTNPTVLVVMGLDLASHVITEAQLATAVQTNGTIVISSTSNAGLYMSLWEQIEKRLKIEIK